MRQLLFAVTKKDLVIETFRSGGKGGQNQNKRNSGVRIKHPESGAVGESREERQQIDNKKKAFIKLVNSPKFKLWLKLKASYIMQGISDKDIDAIVDEQMQDQYLKIEYYKPIGK